MFTFLLKFSIYFTLSFLILSIPINQKQVFDYLSHLARPYTQQLFGHLQESLDRQIILPKDLAKKFFDITPPKIRPQSATLEPVARREKFTAEEEQMLEKVMEKINADHSWRQ